MDLHLRTVAQTQSWNILNLRHSNPDSWDDSSKNLKTSKNWALIHSGLFVHTTKSSYFQKELVEAKKFLCDKQSGYWLAKVCFYGSDKAQCMLPTAI